MPKRRADSIPPPLALPEKKEKGSEISSLIINDINRGKKGKRMPVEG
jgi:hypothetical protein